MGLSELVPPRGGKDLGLSELVPRGGKDLGLSELVRGVAHVSERSSRNLLVRRIAMLFAAFRQSLHRLPHRGFANSLPRR